MKFLMPMLLIICVAGCTGPKEETPGEAAAVLAELLRSKDYDTLFQERYSEWYKVEAEGVAPKVAIERFSSRWERQYDMLVAMMDQLASSEFTISQSEVTQESETGEVATATVTVDGKEIPYRLYKMKNGKWGFHM